MTPETDSVSNYSLLVGMVFCQTADGDDFSGLAETIPGLPGIYLISDLNENKIPAWHVSFFNYKEIHKINTYHATDSSLYYCAMRW